MGKHRRVGAEDPDGGKPRRWILPTAAAIGCGFLRGLGQHIWEVIFGDDDGPGSLPH